LPTIYLINPSAAASGADDTVRPSAMSVIAAKCNASGFLNSRCLPIR
jgi:hypothetical protein